MRHKALISPFNGERWIVPPEASDAMVEALVARGFVPVGDGVEESDAVDVAASEPSKVRGARRNG